MDFFTLLMGGNARATAPSPGQKVPQPAPKSKEALNTEAWMKMRDDYAKREQSSKTLQTRYEEMALQAARNGNRELGQQYMQKRNEAKTEEAKIGRLIRDLDAKLAIYQNSQISIKHAELTGEFHQAMESSAKRINPERLAEVQSELHEYAQTFEEIDKQFDLPIGSRDDDMLTEQERQSSLDDALTELLGKSDMKALETLPDLQPMPQQQRTPTSPLSRRLAEVQATSASASLDSVPMLSNEAQPRSVANDEAERRRELARRLNQNRNKK